MTDDPIEKMLPQAAALACAVAEDDRDTVAVLLASLATEELYALAILLAAHVDLDQPLTHQLSPMGVMHYATREAAKAFDTTPAALLGRGRHRNISEARAVAMAVCRWAGLTSVEVGRFYGRDHSSVLHAASRVGEDARLRVCAKTILASVGRGELADAENAA